MWCIPYAQCAYIYTVYIYYTHTLLYKLSLKFPDAFSTVQSSILYILRDVQAKSKEFPEAFSYFNLQLKFKAEMLYGHYQAGLK